MSIYHLTILVCFDKEKILLIFAWTLLTNDTFDSIFPLKCLKLHLFTLNTLSSLNVIVRILDFSLIFHKWPLLMPKLKIILYFRMNTHCRLLARTCSLFAYLQIHRFRWLVLSIASWFAFLYALFHSEHQIQ